MKTIRFFSAIIAISTLIVDLSAGYQQTEPHKVGVDLISTEIGEYSPSFDSKNQELFFMRRTSGRFFYTIFSSKRTGDGWSDPVVAPFSGTYRDDAPYVSSDGNTLYFDSMRPHPSVLSGSINIWKVERTEDGWSEPELMENASKNRPNEPDTGVDEYGPAIDENGNLYFYSFRQPYRPGKRFIASKSSGFMDAEPIDEIPDPSANTFVSYIGFSADGKTAVMEGRHTGRRDTGLFYSCKAENGTWSSPELIPFVNSVSSDGGPFLTADGNWLYFASNRPATETFDPRADIYRISTEKLPIPCE